MKIVDISQIFDFIKQVETLKDTLRTAHTSGGRIESVAEHTWRLCIMAVIYHKMYFTHLDFQKLIKMCLIHDLGEIVNGDIPAPQQNCDTSKSESERKDLATILKTLPGPLQEDFLEIWEEYESASTEEAKLAKALDKLETLIQHNQGANPEDFDYGFNIAYGKKYTDYDESISLLRKLIDEETKSNITRTSK